MRRVVEVAVVTDSPFAGSSSSFAADNGAEVCAAGGSVIGVIGTAGVGGVEAGIAGEPGESSFDGSDAAVVAGEGCSRLGPCAAASRVVVEVGETVGPPCRDFPDSSRIGFVKDS